MLLDGKNAIIYGGGGAIGGAVARAFAREGAKVHLAGRTPLKLEAVADEIRATRGQVVLAIVQSPEGRTVQATAALTAALERPVDAATVSWAAGFLRSGHRVQDLTTLLLTSPEVTAGACRSRRVSQLPGTPASFAC